MNVNESHKNSTEEDPVSIYLEFYWLPDNGSFLI